MTIVNINESKNMKILWVSNKLFPELSKELGLPSPISGGWMYSAAQKLISSDTSISLAVASVYNGNQLKCLYLGGITYYLVPIKNALLLEKKNSRYNKSLEKYWRIICDEFKPDIIHLHGTEFAHGLALLNICNSRKTIVSIQGLVSVIQQYYYADINLRNILFNLTFKDIFGMDSIINQKRGFKKRGKIEIEILNKVNNVIGRTFWDRTHALSINKKLKYYFCNETLRENFYHKKWEYEKCEPYSIFLSQASYPLKGLHIVLKSLPYLIDEFPNIKVYIAGKDITNTSKLKNKILFTGYGKYIKKLILKKGLSSYISFLGPLNEEKMVERYLKSNIFICPSSIENSPNSLGEAQILGVPCIASYVGGVPDMIEDNKTGMLYRFEDYKILAAKIREIFLMKKNKLKELSNNEAEIARKRHDLDVNTRRLIEIYNAINKE